MGEVEDITETESDPEVSPEIVLVLNEFLEFVIDHGLAGGDGPLMFVFSPQQLGYYLAKHVKRLNMSAEMKEALATDDVTAETLKQYYDFNVLMCTEMAKTAFDLCCLASLFAERLMYMLYEDPETRTQPKHENPDTITYFGLLKKTVVFAESF